MKSLKDSCKNLPSPFFCTNKWVLIKNLFEENLTNFVTTICLTDLDQGSEMIIFES
jgi:hypothetical protein